MSRRFSSFVIGTALALAGVLGQPMAVSLLAAPTAPDTTATPPPLAATPAPVPSATPAASPAPSKVEAPPSRGQNLARELNDAFISVFDHVAPAVVVVDVSRDAAVDGDNNPMDYFGDFFFRRQPDDDQKDPHEPAPHPHRTQSEGSGFIIQADGYILTNNHVVQGGNKIEVRLKDGRTFPAKLVGIDEKTDIAAIKIDAANLPTVEFADSDAVRVGQLCFAIGVPFQQDYTFTQGVVSAKNRSNLNMATYEDYIQTDASINPGNSGGPLLDLDGHVIGMNTLINGLNRGLGFAIPSNMLSEIGSQLIKNGRIVRPFLGVRIETLTEDEATRDAAMFGGVKKGVVVKTIEPDTPAYKSDLKPADVITEVDGVPVSTDRELQHQILGKKVGATVQLTVVRKGKSIKVPVTTGELPSDLAVRDNKLPTQDNNPPEKAPNMYGLQIQKITKDLAESLGLPDDNGVIVTSVAEDSPAARAGIKVKDVITEIGDKPVTDEDSFKEALRGADSKRGIDVYIARGGSKTFVVLKG